MATKKITKPAKGLNRLKSKTGSQTKGLNKLIKKPSLKTKPAIQPKSPVKKAKALVERSPKKIPAPKPVSSAQLRFSLPPQSRIQTAEGWKRSQIKLRQQQS